MTLPFQTGDILHVSRLAWDIYQAAFHQPPGAGPQYGEFLRDVRSLIDNLGTINRIAENAAQPLQHHLDVKASQPPWDLKTLQEILGDYNQTLQEYYSLLKESTRFDSWSLVLQQDVDRLRSRIALHNRKTFWLLRPFELDVLSRVHWLLCNSVAARQHDIRYIVGVVIPDFPAEMREQQQGQQTASALLSVPLELSNRFQLAAQRSRPDLADGKEFPIVETVGAFVTHFEQIRQEVGTDPARATTTNAGPDAAYIRLLKTLWLMEQLKRCRKVQQPDPNSHWPSLIRELDRQLSHVCWQLTPVWANRRVGPNLFEGGVDEFAFDIWPASGQPSSNHPWNNYQKWMMKELVEVALQSQSPSVTYSLRLLQVLDGTSSQYRVIETAKQLVPTGEVRTEERAIEFDLQKARLVPHYALPPYRGDSHNLVLDASGASTSYSFRTLKDLLKFQHAFTGFKPYAFYSQHVAKVAFVVASCRPVEQDAVIQIWIPKQVEGELVSDEPQETTSSSMPQSPDSIAGHPLKTMPVELPADNYDIPISPTQSVSSGYSNFCPAPVPFGPDSYNAPLNPPAYCAWSKETGSSGSYRTSTPASSCASFRTSKPASSGASIITGRSTTSQRTVTVIDTGGSKGYLHQKPLRPTLVIYSRERDGLRRPAITCVKMDDETQVNPERCDCRKGVNSTCVITAIERSKGGSVLHAQRYVASEQLEGFDVGFLGVTRRKEYPHCAYEGLKRISIAFRDTKERQIFGGLACRCKVVTQGELNACIKAGHRGLFGEAREKGRQELREYHRTMETRQDVVVGQAPSTQLG